MTSCLHYTPDEWYPADHRKQMNQCRMMCSEQVLKYDPFTGQCLCRKQQDLGLEE